MVPFTVTSNSAEPLSASSSVTDGPVVSSQMKMQREVDKNKTGKAMIILEYSIFR